MVVIGGHDASVIRSPSLVILSEAKNLRSPVRVNSAKDPALILGTYLPEPVRDSLLRSE